MSTHAPDETRAIVREHDGQIASRGDRLVAAGHRDVRRVGDDRGPHTGRRPLAELLSPGVLRVTCEPAPWQDVASRVRPFIARRVPAPDVDDVMQDVFVRMQRGLAGLRDDERLSGWLFQIARSAIAEHGRARARHPQPEAAEVPDLEAPAADDDDRETARELSGCVATFVARLPSPYREAVTLVELEGLTAREAADLAGISVSGMKSRVQRGRAQLRALFEECCSIALDVRNKVVEYAPRDRCGR